MMSELKKVGKVMDYYSNIGVVAIELTDNLKVGDTIVFKGHTTDFKQEVKSMQIDKEDVEEAHKGDDVGIKVKNRVRETDTVYKKV